MRVLRSHPHGHRASNLIGETVYNGTGDDAEKIGDVNELVIGKKATSNPSLSASAAFLALARKTLPKIKWAEKDGDRWIVGQPRRTN
jgi:PRC-barrel domain